VGGARSDRHRRHRGRRRYCHQDPSSQTQLRTSPLNKTKHKSKQNKKNMKICKVIWVVVWGLAGRMVKRQNLSFLHLSKRQRSFVVYAARCLLEPLYLRKLQKALFV
jgi:hypothetical protein